MKRALLPVFLLLSGPALAQWQVPLNSVPVGRGGATTGFANSGAFTSGQILIGQASGPPLAKTVTGDCSLSVLGAFTCSSSGGITALTGDITGTGPGSTVATLATVNANVGSFGSGTAVGAFTVNGKGLITAASAVTIAPPFSAITGQLTLAQLPTMAANTALVNATAGAAVPTAYAMPSCPDTGGNHLNWVTSTGFTCGTSGGGGSGITALTGNVTASGTGSVVATIANTAVTNAMLAGSIAASKLVGTDIATVGTITAGIWQGTAINIASYATGILPTASTPVSNIRTVTSGTSVAQSDNGGVVELNSSSGLTFTLGALNNGTRIDVVQLGTGQVTLSASGTTLSTYGSLTKTSGQYAGVTCYYKTSGTLWVCLGSLSP